MSIKEKNQKEKERERSMQMQTNFCTNGREGTRERTGPVEEGEKKRMEGEDW